MRIQSAVALAMPLLLQAPGALVSTVAPHRKPALSCHLLRTASLRYRAICSAPQACAIVPLLRTAACAIVPLLRTAACAIVPLLRTASLRYRAIAPHRRAGRLTPLSCRLPLRGE